MPCSFNQVRWPPQSPVSVSRSIQLADRVASALTVASPPICASSADDGLTMKTDKRAANCASMSLIFMRIGSSNALFGEPGSDYAGQSVVAQPPRSTRIGRMPCACWYPFFGEIATRWFRASGSQVMISSDRAMALTMINFCRDTGGLSIGRTTRNGLQVTTP